MKVQGIEVKDLLQMHEDLNRLREAYRKEAFEDVLRAFTTIKAERDKYPKDESPEGKQMNEGYDIAYKEFIGYIEDNLLGTSNPPRVSNKDS